jgi:hypothetical protein
MTTVTKINKSPAQSGVTVDLQLKAWELAALVVSGLTFAAMTWALLSDFSVRRVLWPSAGEGSLAHPIGRVTYSLNKTLRQGQDQPEFVALSQSDPVYPLDTIMAGPGSALKITLDDNSVVEVGENSMIRLNFDSRLRLSGINRETIVEVVTGTVAAKGGEQAQIKVKSQDKTYLATQDRALELSRRGTETATAEAKDIDLVAKTEKAAKAAQALQIAQARDTFAKMGGVMTSNKAVNPVKELAPKLAAGGGALGESLAHEQSRVAMNTKVADDMLGATAVNSNRVRHEIAKAFAIEPGDNYMVKTKTTPANFEFPVKLKWKADPENASFVVRFSLKGQPDETVKVTANDGEAALDHVFRRPGDYSWKIEDFGGAVLSVRSLHINSNFQAIQLSDPVLIGRERGSKMWGAQDKWGFLFKWKPVKGVRQYKVRITRNIKTDTAAPALAEHVTAENEFVLPFKKDWQAEKMFFSVMAIHPQGFELASNNVPFIFTFLPPKPRIPSNKYEFNRMRLTEGIINLNWETTADMDKFTIEIARDPGFHDKVESEQTSENTYRFYPPANGRYYWHVRGDKETLSSPFSETWEFSLK